MKKIEILIGLELVWGPVLKNYELEDGTFSSGSPIVDNDPIINKLDKEVNDLWCSLISDDENSHSGIKFDYKREKELAPKLLNLIKQIENIFNDGEIVTLFVIKDT